MNDTAAIMALAFEYRHAIDDRGTKYRALREAIDRLARENEDLREQNTMLDQKLAELDQRLDDARSEATALRVNEQNLEARLAAGEPVAWLAISYDGVSPYKLSEYGDGPLLDLEIKRLGGTARKMYLYTHPQPQPAPREPLTDAAPELLDALKELAALDFGAPIMNDDDTRRIDFVARRARAAIAKAEGKP